LGLIPLLIQLPFVGLFGPEVHICSIIALLDQLRFADLIDGYRMGQATEDM